MDLIPTFFSNLYYNEKKEMNILNEIFRGAAQQFGREFGRAGANSILKGKNYYQIKSNPDFSERIKPSDSVVVKSIKEINKIKFVTTNKANISRLIEVTDLASNAIIFNGVETLNELNDIKFLLNVYNDKFEHGSALIDENYDDKSVEFLESKRHQFVEQMNSFNKRVKEFITNNYRIAKRRKKSKAVALVLSFPILGGFGAHKFYFGEIGYGILYFLFFWTSIPSIIAFITFIKILFLSEDKFNLKYNPVYSFYNQFKIED